MNKKTSHMENSAVENFATDNAANQPVPGQASSAQIKPSGKNIFYHVGVTQMLLAALTAIFIWQWLDGHRAINDMQLQLAQKIAEMGGGSKTSQALQSDNQEKLREHSAKIISLETRLAEVQNQRFVRDAFENELAASRTEIALAEVEQMLLMAEQQLQLSGNVKAALIAIQAADARLQLMNRPALNGLRKAIIHDMDKLRALPGVDVTGISIRINALIASVDKMPLAYQQHAAGEAVTPTIAPKDETAWQLLLREIWQEFRQLVRIENTGKDEIPLLTPSQELFLRENLKLHLLSARIALQSFDENTFKQELATAQHWTSRYFDGKSGETVRVLAALKRLATSDTKIELPDISPSVQAVRNYRMTREKNTR